MRCYRIRRSSRNRFGIDFVSPGGVFLFFVDGWFSTRKKAERRLKEIIMTDRENGIEAAEFVERPLLTA